MTRFAGCSVLRREWYSARSTKRLPQRAITARSASNEAASFSAFAFGTAGVLLLLMSSYGFDKFCLSMRARDYLTVAEAAELLNLSEQTIYRRVWAGDVPVVRLTDHGAIRIPRSALEVPAEHRAPFVGRAVEAQAHGGKAA